MILQLPLQDDQHLVRRLQAVLQVLPGRVVGDEGEARQLWLPHGDALVQSVEELLHDGRSVKAHHLQEQRRRAVSCSLQRETEQRRGLGTA